MSPEEMLLEHHRIAREGDQDLRLAGEPQGSLLGVEEVPPVRTIVLDRPPTAVALPLRDRNPLRDPSLLTTGPERLSLSELSVNYGGKPAVKSVSLSIHQGEVLALI